VKQIKTEMKPESCVEDEKSQLLFRILKLW